MFRYMYKLKKSSQNKKVTNIFHLFSKFVMPDFVLSEIKVFADIYHCYNIRNYTVLSVIFFRSNGCKHTITLISNKLFPCVSFLFKFYIDLLAVVCFVMKVRWCFTIVSSGGQAKQGRKIEANW